jgi:hypothetical protein
MTRLEALIIALGQQGGTIHQLAKTLGLTVEDILTYKPTDKSFMSDYDDGFCGVVMKGVESQRKYLLNHKGNINYFCGVADGVIYNYTH